MSKARILAAVVALFALAPVAAFAQVIPVAGGTVDCSTGIFTDSITLVQTPATTAQSAGCPKGNGNPENVVNIWGTTNSGIPHVQPGQSVTDQWVFTSLCPAWFTNYCVDISHTAYYIALHNAAFGVK